MKTNNVYCEPFCLRDGEDFEIHHISYGKQDTYSCFTHFHQVHEFIFFEQIEGKYLYHRGESDLADFDAVFTPSMETHNFTLSTRPKSWFIIQFVPNLFANNISTQFFEKFKIGSHMSFDLQTQERVHQLLNIILSAYKNNPKSIWCKQLVLALFYLVLEKSIIKLEGNQTCLSTSKSFEKLLPIIARFTNSKTDYCKLDEAAAICNLSCSHFSRQFKKHFRMSYTDYVIQHKLYGAARELSQTDTPVTDIAYDLDFSSPSYFIRQFKAQFSVTPFQYRQQLRAQ